MGQYAINMGWQKKSSDIDVSALIEREAFCKTCEYNRSWPHETEDGIKYDRHGCGLCRNAEGQVCPAVRSRHIRAGTKPGPQCPSPHLRLTGKAEQTI